MRLKASIVHNDVPEMMQRGHFAIRLFANYTGEHFSRELSFHAPRGKTKELSNSFSAHEISPLVYLVNSTAEHSLWVREGTGVFGKHNTPLMPTQRKALKFFWDKVGAVTVWKGDLPPGEAQTNFRRWAKANNMVPFTKWPRGMRGRDYVTPAMWATEARSDRLLNKALRDMKVDDV